MVAARTVPRLKLVDVSSRMVIALCCGALAFAVYSPIWHGYVSVDRDGWPLGAAPASCPHCGSRNTNGVTPRDPSAPNRRCERCGERFLAVRPKFP